MTALQALVICTQVVLVTALRMVELLAGAVCSCQNVDSRPLIALETQGNLWTANDIWKLP